MIRVRGRSAGTGHTTRFIDENVKVVEPSIKSPKKGTGTRSGKRKQSTRKKLQTTEPSVEQSEEQQTAEQIVVQQQTAKHSTRKSPRTRSEVQGDVPIA